MRSFHGGCPSLSLFHSRGNTALLSLSLHSFEDRRFPTSSFIPQTHTRTFREHLRAHHLLRDWRVGWSVSLSYRFDVRFLQCQSWEHCSRARKGSQKESPCLLLHVFSGRSSGCYQRQGDSLSATPQSTPLTQRTR